MIPTQCRICGTRFLARTREEALCPDCRLAAKRAELRRRKQYEADRRRRPKKQ